jgi:hypothetical protein
MNPGVAIGINCAVTFGTAFAAALAAGYSWKEALAAGMAAMLGNQSALYQRSPLK